MHVWITYMEMSYVFTKVIAKLISAKQKGGQEVPGKHAFGPTAPLVPQPALVSTSKHARILVLC